jgi:hypothetical protein
LNQDYEPILIFDLHVLLKFILCHIFCVKGKTRARDAALNAIQSPLLDIGIERATGIVWNITGGTDLTLFEVTTYPSGSCALILAKYTFQLCP